MFSKKAGLRPTLPTPTLDDFMAEQRIRVWSVMHELYIDPAVENTHYDSPWVGPLRQLLLRTWMDLIGRPTDSIPHNDHAVSMIRGWYFEEAEWWEAFDLVEQLPVWVGDPTSENRPEFYRNAVSDALAATGSGYRFVGEDIAQITSPTEIESVQNAIGKAKAPWEIHLASALALYSDRKQPDYRNSAKESISAVEAAARRVAGKDASLGDALKEIEKAGHPIHPALREGFSKIYGYTSDKTGIRHALTEQSDPVEEPEARFMLIACSTFVHYLLQRGS